MLNWEDKYGNHIYIKLSQMMSFIDAYIHPLKPNKYRSRKNCYDMDLFHHWSNMQYFFNQREAE